MDALTAHIKETGGDGELAVTVRWVQRESDGRDRFRWTVAYQGEEMGSDDDLRSGCQGGDHPEMLASLLGYLGAAAESFHYAGNRMSEGSNTDMFPQPVCEVAYQMSDEIAMAERELSDDDEI